MAVITLPTGAKFKRVVWSLQQPGQVNRSPYSGARHVTALGAAVWRAEFQVIPITREVSVRPWRAFLAALRGQVNTFNAPALNINSIGGNATASAAAAAGTSALAITGFTGRTAPAGSYATIVTSAGNQLVVLTADRVGNGSMTFQPPLRWPVAISNAIEFLNPWCGLALMEDTFTIEGVEGQGFAVSFAAEEAY